MYRLLSHTQDTFPPGLTHTRVQHTASSSKASEHRDRARRQSRFRSLRQSFPHRREALAVFPPSPSPRPRPHSTPSSSSRAGRRHARESEWVRACIASAPIALPRPPPCCCQLAVRLESPSHTNTQPNTAPPCLFVAAAPAKRSCRRHPRSRLASSAMLSLS
jgi:hypothetical protein